MSAALHYDLAAVTPAMQDYLKAIYHLQDGTGLVTTQHLAEALDISSPSVTNMVKRLHELGLARHTRYQGVELTESGQQVALEVIRHHRLLELYLVDVLGFPWDEAHAEAECLEHYVSEEMEERIDVALGHPTRDPHGNPIPSQDGAVTERRDRRLLDLEPGEGGLWLEVGDATHLLGLPLAAAVRVIGDAPAT